MATKTNYHKWDANITVVIKDFKDTLRALIDTEVDHNCIREGLVPTKYFEKTTERLRAANKQKLEIKYKLSKVHVCVGNICFENTFLLVKNLSQDLILGTPFISQIYAFRVTRQGLKSEVMGRPLEIKFCYDIKEREIDELKVKRSSFDLEKETSEYFK